MYIYIYIYIYANVSVDIILCHHEMFLENRM